MCIHTTTSCTAHYMYIQYVATLQPILLDTTVPCPHWPMVFTCVSMFKSQSAGFPTFTAPPHCSLPVYTIHCHHVLYDSRQNRGHCLHIWIVFIWLVDWLFEWNILAGSLHWTCCLCSSSAIIDSRNAGHLLLCVVGRAMNSLKQNNKYQVARTSLCRAGTVRNHGNTLFSLCVYLQCTRLHLSIPSVL